MKFCRARCPHGFVDCGLGLFSCAPSTNECRSTLARMSIMVIAAAAKSAGLVLTAGGSFGANAATRSALQAAARAAWPGFKERVLNADKGLLAKRCTNVAKKTINMSPEKLYSACEQATVALQQTVSKDEKVSDVVEKTDWTAFDVSVFPTDRLTSAEAWVKAFSTFDPTGWIAAAGVFIRPKCDPQGVGELKDDSE